MSTVPHIVRNGGEWYAAMGVNRSKGTRLFSVSGQVERPGNYEVELGITFRDLIDGLAGGVKGGKKLGFFIPGWRVVAVAARGAPRRRARHGLRADRAHRRDHHARLGAVMVFDEDVDPLLIAWRIAKFFAHESCGKCTPCREGSGWIEKVLYRMAHGHGRPDDLDLLLVVRQQPRARPQLAARHDHDLPARPEHDVAGRQPQPLLARRDHRTHDSRHRAPRRAGVRGVS